MKIEKNKIVFTAVLMTVVIFIISYSIMVMGDDESQDLNLKETAVPELKEEQKKYDSKLEAINDIKEERESDAPSVYDEKLIDSLGFYNSDLANLQKDRLLDSISNAEENRYSRINYQNLGDRRVDNSTQIDSVELKEELKIAGKEMGLEHQLFFASDPKNNEFELSGSMDDILHAVVDGDQVVKADSRLRMRLTKAVTLHNEYIPRNTPVYGFVKFQPNRVMIDIHSIKNHPVELKAFDLEDGSEGVYVENNFRAQVSTEVIGDMVDDINIAGMPQVSGFKNIFQRNNRNVKVTVLNNYQVILKP
ncbi:conjugative transposon protein TraM [Psychroflexus montanilacus]|uniref:conjugative transposon protein TraM n=1 Tax=Psychroflexus montanilacus TaxID=2873598 RepID=UPI001CCFF85A|nr:conjugative transposon protein TraM [Psychroflexus montanilacus]MBZ9650888.1 conjugative transposon protein TraM [Psychroflexus montanilacus]